MPKDYPKAAQYFEKSGDDLYNGFDEVCYNFGDMYRYGEGVEKNLAKAVKWYEVQAHCGDRNATFALAEIYRDGEGNIKPDGEKAVRYFMELAFNSGDYFFVTDTKIYEDEQDVPMSYSEKVYYSSFDCSQGDDEAKFALGCMYLYGQAVAKDVYKAAWWFAKMDELDLYENGEIFDLAEMYRTGDGVEQDIDKALEYYERAADGGNVQAAYKLAKIYRDGAGVEKDLDEAQRYLDKTIEGLLKNFKE